MSNQQRNVLAALAQGGNPQTQHVETEIKIAAELALRDGVFQVAVVALLGVLVIGASIFGYFYFHYQHVVDDRIASGPIFASVSQIYAAPREVRDGQKLSAGAIAADLRQAGYNGNSQLGTYQLNGDNIFIKPGPESYHNTDGATINTSGGTVQSITAENGAALSAYELEPQLIGRHRVREGVGEARAPPLVRRFRVRGGERFEARRVAASRHGPIQ